MSSRLALAMSATALVVALLGSTPLGHALASQVPRNSVGPLQIKRNAVGPQKIAPNAVRTSHVLDGSLLTADFKPGQIPQGPKGDKGDKGNKGDEGAPGMSQREVISSPQQPLDSSNTKVATANCPAGKAPIGGGAGISGSVVAVPTSSVPIGNSWQAIAHEMVASSANWRLTATVICAKVAP